MGWGEAGQDGADCPIAEGAGHNGRFLTLGKQLTVPCPVGPPCCSRPLGESATEPCSRIPLDTAPDRSYTSPSFRKHLPSTWWYQGLCTGLGRGRGTHILVKHLYILPDVSLDLPSVHRPHRREGVGSTKVVPTHSPYLGTESANYQRRGEELGGAQD